MRNALEAAWAKFDPPPKDAELARLLMASAIIDAVDAGLRSEADLTEKALLAFTVAARISATNLTDKLNASDCD